MEVIIYVVFKLEDYDQDLVYVGNDRLKAYEYVDLVNHDVNYVVEEWNNNGLRERKIDLEQLLWDKRGGN